jgi:hypothetical protein
VVEWAGDILAVGDERVVECDLFAIILGHQHGTCPDGSEKSYTELQYDKAVGLKKTLFIFVADEDLAASPGLSEADAQCERQHAFRERATKA